MNPRIPALVGAILLLGIAPAPSGADVPRTISFEGTLTTPAGAPVPDGNQSVLYSLYDAPAAPTPLWTGAYTVPTVKGAFRVSLGDPAVSPFPAGLKFDAPYWLGMKVGEDAEMTPRIPLQSVPYALNVPSGLFWGLGGNAGTDPSTNFLGTTDNKGLEVKVNGVRALRIEPTNRGANLIGGYLGNGVAIGAESAVIAGGGAPGLANAVYDDFGFIGGGGLNIAGSADATYNNDQFATIGGGFSNVARRYATVGGGYGNTAGANVSTVGGGVSNQAAAYGATVAGGVSNWASNDSSTVAGGYQNHATAPYATIPGGLNNTAAGSYSLAAGYRAKAQHNGSMVFADSTDADFLSTGVNQFLVRASGGLKLAAGTSIELGFGISPKEQNAGTIGYGTFTPNTLDIVGGGISVANRKVWIHAEGGTTFTGGIQAFGTLYSLSGGVRFPDNTLQTTAAIPSGTAWLLGGNAGTNPASAFLGTTDNKALQLRVRNEAIVRYLPTVAVGTASIVAGSPNNAVMDGAEGSVVGGGGNAGTPNKVFGYFSSIAGGLDNVIGVEEATLPGTLYATISGGVRNRATAHYAVVAGGLANQATAATAFVGGGDTNRADGYGSVVAGGASNFAGSSQSVVAGGGLNHASNNSSVGGGLGNHASGQYSTIPGGFKNEASAEGAFSAGRSATAAHAGSFVWSDGSEGTVASTAANQFLVHALGGVGINATDPSAALDVNGLIRSRIGGVRFPDGSTQLTAAVAAVPGWSLAGNAGTDPSTQFVGTTDNQALEFRVNNLRVVRYAPNPDGPSIIGGFSGNWVRDGEYAMTVAGGGENGKENKVRRTGGAVGGGVANTAGTPDIPAESYGFDTVAGGYGNSAMGGFASVVGGNYNSATGTQSAVLGGGGNTASGQGSAVAGGNGNEASGLNATVAGGWLNRASGFLSFAAGAQAQALHAGSWVWADSMSSQFSSTADNQFLLRAAGGVGINTNTPAFTLDVAGPIRARSIGFVFPDGTTQASAGLTPASGWALTGNAGTIPGTNFIGTTDSQPLEMKVNGARALRVEPTTGTPNLVGGYGSNSAKAGTAGVFIGGGGAGGGSANSVYDNYSLVSGGSNNKAGSNDADFTNAAYAAVGGGTGNTASGQQSTVGGGSSNAASGTNAMVPGGFWNTAAGAMSFAAGRRARANDDGSFVWGDFTNADVTSYGANTFSVRAAGGARFYSNAGLTAGVDLPAGGGSWASLSDRNAKREVRPVDARSILEKVSAMPVSTWRYESQDSVRHIGPMAQDFSAAFGVGESEKRITTVDADGVALAAIQGLYDVVKEKDARIAELEARLARLEAVVAAK